jgi:hypothetical protein
MTKLLPCCVREHTEEWRIPIPPARKTAGLAVLLWRPKEPIGPSILAPLPIGKMDKARLKTVFRTRVVTRSSSSNGELAMEKV